MNNPTTAHYLSSSFPTGNNLGLGFSLTIGINNVAPQIWGLHTAAERGYFNSGNPLTSPIGWLSAGPDYFDCRETVLPAGGAAGCKPAANRAIYRLINVGQNGILTVSGATWELRYRLYRGDASTAPVVGNEIQGLVDQAGCQRPYYWWERFKVCVTPGVYTLVSFGDDSDIKRGDNPQIYFEAFPATQYTDPLNPQVTANLSSTNTTVTSATVRFNCMDNPETIIAGGTPYAPCNGATKMTYHEIFVENELSVTFSVSHSQYMNDQGGVQARIFQGRRSTGSLTGIFANCTSGFTQNRCSQTMAPGWYTIVLYGWEGQTFAAPTYTSGRGGILGNTASWTLSGLTPYTPQRFKTIATADSSLKHTQKVAWLANPGHTVTVPNQARSYNFATEYWDCNHNLPLESGIVPCGTTGQFNRHSFRVFELTKASYVYISGINPYPYGYMSKLYRGDLRALPTPAPGDEYPVEHPCMHDEFRLCLPPGLYTLVTFANNNHIGYSQTPSIYVDSLGVSKHDFARNAYDYGLVPTDNSEYFGAVGAPLDAFGRTPSDDFFMCATWASTSDPYTAANGGLCDIGSMPPMTPAPNSYNPRRNLWYTFQVQNPGFVHVTGYMLTPNRTTTARMEVFRSDDVNFNPGAGVVDSTLAQGLTFVGTTRVPSWWCPNNQGITFYRDPCRETALTRYYVLVTDYSAHHPNAQFRLGIRMEPAPPDYIYYDHYSDANEINTTNGINCAAPYLGEVLSSGTFTGCLGNLNCATKDVPDQNTCGTHTIWYKFTVSSSGLVRINYNRPNGQITWADADMQLYRQVVPGDSTSAGLVKIPLTGRSLANPDFNHPTVYTWGEGCMNPGTYYILFTGCSYPTETVIPRIWLVPDNFDLCQAPGAFTVNSFGTYSTMTTINCHSIGEGPGEDGTNMGCFGVPTGRKTQWVRVDLNINDTTDMDIQLIPMGMNVIGDSVRYRIGYGTCSSMTFDNCIYEGANIILNLRCRLPGSYWIQSIMPDWATGQLEYKVTFTESNTTTCTPIDPQAPNAVFTFNANCVDEPVYFTNYSTAGDVMSYRWNFGDGSPVSTDINPIHQYVTPGTYPVTLIAIKTLIMPDTVLYDTITRLVTVQPRPVPSFTLPVTVLAGEPFTISNTSTNTIVSSAFLWDFCAAGAPNCGTSPASSLLQNPAPVTYNIAGTKTICLTIFNGTCSETVCHDIEVTYQNIFTGGPYDGFGVVKHSNVCELNIFTGGPYDGHDMNDSLADCAISIFAGGPYDGFAVIKHTSICELNIFTGGPYDGHDLNGNYPNCIMNIFAGGPYDGFAIVKYQSVCIENIYVGGPYDGHDAAADLADCDVSIFAGGPYDGFSVVKHTSICELNIFTGGPHDGHDVNRLLADCDYSIFAGGPYDGFSVVKYQPQCQPNIFVGGPYDGTDPEARQNECLLNIWSGGPYDGHAYDIINSFDAYGDEVCIGQQATLTSQSPADWYSVRTGGAPLVTNTTTYVTPVLTQTRVFWAQSVCCPSCDRVPVIAQAQRSLTPSFSYVPACTGLSSSFTNTTIVSSTPTPSIGSGRPISGLATTGTPPGPGQLSFVNGTVNFSQLTDGVHNNYTAWNGANAAAATQWVQWNYVTPRSVGRIYWWNAFSSAYQNNQAIVAKLYYGTSSGWVMAKAWVLEYPTTGNFDTGLIGETNGLFANRWMLELDVPVANGPNWGEFQVLASTPTIGSGTVTWDFGDGHTASGSPATHTFPNGNGTYDVTMTFNANGLCPTSVTQSVPICDDIV
ncbi:MAG: PKD domain-containing protein, partial [Bacteroidetes bacterium]|nr:PKD domain-containing protein [Bacteroidota bacterium]